MAEEFQGGVCGGNWPWNSSRNLFGSSPCSLATNDIGPFGWPSNHDMVIDMNAARSSDDSAGSTSDGGGSVVIQTKMTDSPFQMMGISLSSSATADVWNQDLLDDSGRSVENYSNFMLDSYQHETIDENSGINSISTTTDQSAVALSNGFPLNSASYNYASSLLQTLFDTDSQPQPSVLDNQLPMNYSSSNYQMNSNGLNLPKTIPMMNPSFPKPQPTKKAPLWNAPTAALSNVRSSFLPTTHSQFLPSSLNHKRPNLPSTGSKHQHEEGKNSTSVAKKASNEPAYTRQRIETPSPLPTFKVRKEKLGDRITALQQLVSPFGKTDTASVLHEAIDYIKFLHDQVNALSTPYLKYGSPLQHQQGAEKTKDQEGLQSRGLCLVPISSTFPVATETPSDFWTPTFGVNLK